MEGNTKKTFKAILISVAAALCAVLCIAFAACGDSTASGDGDEKITTIWSIGEFSGHQVDYVKIEIVGVDVTAVVNDLVVRDSELGDVTLITEMPGEYHIIVYTSSTDYVMIYDAYSQGLVTHDDLLSIQALAKEKGYYRGETDVEEAELVE